MRILIIRHGEPDYEHDSLTEKGFEEAELLSRELIGEHIDAIYCSPLGRARATAAPTVRKTGIQPVIFDWLREFPVEMHHERHDMYTCPWCFNAVYWTNFDENFRGDDFIDGTLYGDSNIKEKLTEVRENFDSLLAEYGFVRNGHIFDLTAKADEKKTIALFCHHGLGMVLLSYLTGCPLPVMWHSFHLITSSVTEVVMEKHSDKAFARCIRMSDVSHLYKFDHPASMAGLQKLI